MSERTPFVAAALLGIVLVGGARGQDQQVTELVNDAFQAMLMHNVSARTYSGTASSAGQTPVTFLKGAAANHGVSSSQRERRRLLTVLTWTAPQTSPSGMPYTVKGYINDANFVQRIETSVDNAKIEANFDEYIQTGKVVVPVRITVTRPGAPAFDTAITAASPDPPNLAQLLAP